MAAVAAVNSCSASGCDNRASSSCSGCACAHYCGAACQAAAWASFHRAQCVALRAADGGARAYRRSNRLVCSRRFEARGASDGAPRGVPAAAAALAAASSATAFGAALCALLAEGGEAEALAALSGAPPHAAAAAALATVPLWPLLVAAERGSRGLGVVRWLLAHAPAAPETARAGAFALPARAAAEVRSWSREEDAAPTPASALGCAAAGGCAETVDALAGAGARIAADAGAAHLAAAAEAGDDAAPGALALVSALLRAGARVDAPVGTYEASPLAAAARAVGEATRRALAAAQPAARAADGACARARALAVLEVLLASLRGTATAAGAADALTAGRESALAAAANEPGDTVEAVAMLLAAGADASAPRRRSDGSAPQYHRFSEVAGAWAEAAAVGNLRCLRELLRAPGGGLPPWARMRAPTPTLLTDCGVGSGDTPRLVHGVGAHSGAVLAELLGAGLSPALAYWAPDLAVRSHEGAIRGAPRTLVAAVAATAPDAAAAAALTVLAAAGAPLDEVADAEDWGDASGSDDTSCFRLPFSTGAPAIAFAALLAKPLAVAALVAGGARLDVSVAVSDASDGEAAPTSSPAALLGDALAMGCIDSRDTDCAIAAARRPRYSRVLTTLLDADAARAAAPQPGGGATRRLDVTSPSALTGWTPLMAAAAWAPSAVVERLLAAAGDGAALVAAHFSQRVKGPRCARARATTSTRAQRRSTLQPRAAARARSACWRRRPAARARAPARTPPRSLLQSPPPSPRPTARARRRPRTLPPFAASTSSQSSSGSVPTRAPCALPSPRRCPCAGRPSFGLTRARS